MTTPTRTPRRRLLEFVTDAAARLTAAWDILPSAQTVLLAVLARIRPGRTAPARIRAASQVFQQAVAEFNRTAVAFAERWASVDLPQLYRDGALRALADATIGRVWQWTTDHQAAITSLTATFYTDLVARISEAVRRARAFLRAATEQARHPEGIDRDQLLRDHPLDRVVYAGDHRHPAHAWASSALTWQAVATSNTAAAQAALLDLGADWVEVRDGAGCGWESHQDPDTADGSLRTVADALAHPAAHPNCQRQFLPRPDIRIGDLV